MYDPSRFMSRSLLLLAIAGLMLFGGCAVSRKVCVTGDVAYCEARGNFTGRWYDYYERALSCMDSGCNQAALEDLQEAIRRREGDQRRARTVGMHFIDYFPHREKGLIHYLEGDYAAAKTELERSLNQYPSEKARFYLDRARAQLFRRADRIPTKPRLTLTLPASPADGIVWTRDDPVRIAGTAVDRDEFIADIAINGSPVFVAVSGPEVRFSEDLVLAEGRREIDVQARNLLGGVVWRRVMLHVDRSGPLIAVDRFVPGKTVSGNLLDPAGISEFRINGQKVWLSGHGTIPFRGMLHSRTVALTAVDRLGNETRIQLGDGAGSYRASRGWLAMAGSDEKADDGTGILRTSRAADAPLAVDIRGLTDPQVVFSETLRVPVEVRSEAQIRHLSVNGKAATLPQGRIISFNAFVRLNPGENRVMVEATDAKGRNVEKRLRIIRRIPEAFQLQHRYGISVHPFDFTEEDPERIRFQHDLLDSLLQPRRFRIGVSEDLQVLLDRQGLVLGEDADWASPHAVLLGVIHETRNGIEAAARMVNVETRETLAVGDVYAPAPDRDALAAMSRRLSEKFLRRFPLMTAEIVDVSENRVRVALPGRETQGASLPRSWPLLVYRVLETGDAAVGSDARIIGDARAADAPSGNVFTAIVEAGAAGDIRPTDRVVAR